MDRVKNIHSARLPPLWMVGGSFIISSTMGNSTVNSQEKLAFPRRIRELREAHGKKQREVAEVLGIETNSYGNCESNNHKTMSLAKVHVLARWYGLSEADTAALAADWDALPASEYTQRNMPAWERKKAFRAKAASYDRMRLILLELTSRLVEVAPDPDTLCSCAPVDMFAAAGEQPPPCEVCAALRELGLPGWTNRDDVIAKLAVVQEGLTG